MLIDNVLTLIEEYVAFKQLPALTKAWKIASARTMISPQQRANMQDSVKKDGTILAKKSAQIVGDSLVPGLGTAGIVGSGIVNLVKTPAELNRGLEVAKKIKQVAFDTNSLFNISPLISHVSHEKLRESSELVGAVPTKTASTMIKNKLQNARSQYILDHLKSKADSEIQQSRVQKICAQNPGLKGC